MDFFHGCYFLGFDIHNFTFILTWVYVVFENIVGLRAGIRRGIQTYVNFCSLREPT